MAENWTMHLPPEVYIKGLSMYKKVNQNMFQWCQNFGKNGFGDE